jgi:NtrC-family two-component system sensor histidine kinase KinB
MGYFQTFIRQFRARLFVVILINNGLILIDWYVVNQVIKLTGWWALVAIVAVPLLTLGVIPWVSTRTLTQPTKFLWQAIMHIAPSTAGEMPAPKPEELQLGRELVTNLISQLYQFTSVVQGMEQTNAKAAQDLRTNFVATSLPLPLLVLNKEEKIVYSNEIAAKYFGKSTSDLIGQNVYTTLDMSFTSDDTLDAWLKATKGKSVIADHSWERVRIGLPGQEGNLQFDLAAHYNQDNSAGYETLLVVFDHTKTYSQDDQSLGFVALGVHELRTPLTLMRGYLEVFDEEIGPSLNPDMQRFMRQMDAAAQQVTAFVDNILNVAKIEDNQLTLQLHEEKWSDMVDSTVNDMRLRAGVRGITIKTDIAPDLPAAGVDRYSMYELIANLLDNAIKYSKANDVIRVTSALNKDDLIETSVIDSGVGIDNNILPHIFSKFYRDHHNRAQIGGTGLGLYLAKTIVEAHGGNIWVNTKQGEGSTFTFKASSSKDITRSAHGWIKNHSLYRD